MENTKELLLGAAALIIIFPLLLYFSRSGWLEVFFEGGDLYIKSWFYKVRVGYETIHVLNESSIQTAKVRF